MCVPVRLRRSAEPEQLEQAPDSNSATEGRKERRRKVDAARRGKARPPTSYEHVRVRGRRAARRPKPPAWTTGTRASLVTGIDEQGICLLIGLQPVQTMKFSNPTGNRLVRNR